MVNQRKYCVKKWAVSHFYREIHSDEWHAIRDVDESATHVPKNDLRDWRVAQPNTVYDKHFSVQQAAAIN